MQIFTSLLLTLFLISYFSIPASGTELKTLKEIYQTGTVEFIPQTEITVDSFEDFADSRLPVDFEFWRDNLYLLDGAAHNLKITDRNGNFKKTIGRKGRGPGDLFGAFSMVVCDNKLLIWELGNLRFSLFTPEGDFIRHVAPFKKKQVMKMRTLANGLLVIESSESPNRDTVGLKLVKLAVYSSVFEEVNVLYEKKVPGSRYVKEIQTSIPPLYSPSLYWDVSGNTVVYGFSESFQIYIRNFSLKPSTTFTHQYKPVKVTEKDKEHTFEHMWSNLRQTEVAKAKRKYYRFPKYKPIFSGIIIDGEGNILVMEYKDRKHEHTKFFDAFDSSGQFISRVEIATPHEGVSFHGVKSEKGDVLWVLGQNDDDYPSLTRFKLK